ncbi:EamA family transporter [Mesorhizobium sp. LSHC412B00]|uniref:EamA family transporter n=1 Tax=Mesorhizobium sp. LSHC412B00 TaxID=1287285 RepID=UPI00359430A1
MRVTEDLNTKPAILAGLAMIGIYAVQFVAARFSLREHLTATDVATLRFVGAGLVMLPVVWRGGLSASKALGWRRALALAALAGLPYPIIINWGLTYAPAAHGAALCPARSCSSRSCCRTSPRRTRPRASKPSASPPSSPG